MNTPTEAPALYRQIDTLQRRLAEVEDKLADYTGASTDPEFDCVRVNVQLRQTDVLVEYAVFEPDVGTGRKCPADHPVALVNGYWVPITVFSLEVQGTIWQAIQRSWRGIEAARREGGSDES